MEMKAPFDVLLYEHILWMHLEKRRTLACTFPGQRKEINVAKVRFTMKYSWRKLSHEKVITTACNFWRQIACSFLVKSGNVLLLGKKNFWACNRLKTSNLTADNFKKYLTSMGRHLSLRYGDTGQRIPCFDSCQLITTLMSICVNLCSQTS